MILRALPIAMLFASCCPLPQPPPLPLPEEKNTNYIYLYARLHESQPAEDARAQYRENLQEALANYQHTIKIEELRGVENTVEYIGIDFIIAAPETETEKLEEHLMNTFRLSGAPYATQILIYEP